MSRAGTASSSGMWAPAMGDEGRLAFRFDCSFQAVVGIVTGDLDGKLGLTGLAVAVYFVDT